MTPRNSRATDDVESSERVRLDRPVLISNLASGAVWIAILAFFATPVLVAVGATYAVLTGVCLAAFYGRPSSSGRQEVMAWVTPWLVAVALWTWVGVTIDGGFSAPAVGLGLVVATPCYVAWQLSALAIRQVMAGRAVLDTEHPASRTSLGARTEL